MNKGINFSVIIPNYNGATFLTECLTSLLKAIENCPQSKFEIILIDNASKDKSLELFEKIIPKSFYYKIIFNQKNYGFAKAVNQGISKAKYQYVVLLNNDLTMETNWFHLISQVISTKKNQKVATYFGTVLTKDGTKFESQGLRFFYRGKAQNISNGKNFQKSLIKKLPSTVQTWGASAAFIVYKKNILQKIGLFDEDFFAYQEDVDLALRLHNLGYKTAYVPQAISYHLGGGTSKKMKNIRSRLSFRNWFFIIIKNYSRKEFFHNSLEIFTERLRNLSYFYKETISVYKWKSFFVFPFDLVKTLIEILINTPKMFKKQKLIQKILTHHSFINEGEVK